MLLCNRAAAYLRASRHRAALNDVDMVLRGLASYAEAGGGGGNYAAGAGVLAYELRGRALSALGRAREVRVPGA